MLAHGFEERKRDAAAQEQVHQLLARMRAQGFYG
jgi:hypothetical protein